jgi:hypothetical protein
MQHGLNQTAPAVRTELERLLLLLLPCCCPPAADLKQLDPEGRSMAALVAAAAAGEKPRLFIIDYWWAHIKHDVHIDTQLPVWSACTLVLQHERMHCSQQSCAQLARTHHDDDLLLLLLVRGLQGPGGLLG